MRTFTVTTEGPNRLGLRELCQHFVDEQWVVDPDARRIVAEYVEDFLGAVVAWLSYLPQARVNLRLLPKLTLP